MEEKYYVVSWSITDLNSSHTFYRKELCRSLSAPNANPGTNFTESIKIDHPNCDVQLIRLKELSKDDFETVLKIVGLDILEV